MANRLTHWDQTKISLELNYLEDFNCMYDILCDLHILAFVNSSHFLKQIYYRKFNTVSETCVFIANLSARWFCRKGGFLGRTHLLILLLTTVEFYMINFFIGKLFL